MTTQMMIPPVCLNCAHLEGLEPNSPDGVNAALPVRARCAWAPTHAHIVDARVHHCAQRKPLDEPIYTVPSHHEAQEDAGTENGASDGARPPQEAIETKIGGTE